MSDKAYIVANKEQELEVLKKFEQQGLFWSSGEKATDWIPSESSLFSSSLGFPYALIERQSIVWSSIMKISDKTITYDGRNKDEKVDTRYKVTQKFMDELIDWRNKNNIDATNGDRTSYLGQGDLVLPYPIINWWLDDKNPIERNNRLIAIIRWLNGEDMFEVKKPHKFLVRNDTPDEDGDYYYVQNYNGITERVFSSYSATKFDTREEAQEWANSHQVIVEIDEEGNEVKE